MVFLGISALLPVTYYLSTSNEPEPSWLEPKLELKDFQLGSARLVTLFTAARRRKLAKNEPKIGRK
jgi:hypothetical protein